MGERELSDLAQQECQISQRTKMKRESRGILIGIAHEKIGMTLRRQERGRAGSYGTSPQLLSLWLT
jgi:hypothetical protein